MVATGDASNKRRLHDGRFLTRKRRFLQTAFADESPFCGHATQIRYLESREGKLS